LTGNKLFIRIEAVTPGKRKHLEGTSKGGERGCPSQERGIGNKGENTAKRKRKRKGGNTGRAGKSDKRIQGGQVLKRTEKFVVKNEGVSVRGAKEKKVGEEKI